MPNIQCSICTERFTQPECIISTPCGHIFHNACMTEWMRRSATCPQCRKDCTNNRCKRVYFDFYDGNACSVLDETLKENVRLNDDVDKQKQRNTQLEKNIAKCENDLKKISKEMSKLITNEAKIKQEITDLKAKYLVKISANNATIDKMSNELKSYQQNVEKAEKVEKAEMERLLGENIKLDAQNKKLHETADNSMQQFLEIEKKYQHLTLENDANKKKMLKMSELISKGSISCDCQPSFSARTRSAKKKRCLDGISKLN